jgi:small-conductance mechanosensitive channel
MKVGELRWPVRVAFYVALLICLALADIVFDDFFGPMAVIVVFVAVVLVVARRASGEVREPIPKASGRAVIFFAAALTLLTAIETALIPDYGLGAVFWIVAILIPALEFLGYFTRREARTQA